MQSIERLSTQLASGLAWLPNRKERNTENEDKRDKKEIKFFVCENCENQKCFVFHKFTTKTKTHVTSTFPA